MQSPDMTLIGSYNSRIQRLDCCHFVNKLTMLCVHGSCVWCNMSNALTRSSFDRSLTVQICNETNILASEWLASFPRPRWLQSEWFRSVLDWTTTAPAAAAKPLATAAPHWGWMRRPNPSVGFMKTVYLCASNALVQLSSICTISSYTEDRQQENHDAFVQQYHTSPRTLNAQTGLLLCVNSAADKRLFRRTDKTSLTRMPNPIPLLPHTHTRLEQTPHFKIKEQSSQNTRINTYS